MVLVTAVQLTTTLDKAKNRELAVDRIARAAEGGAALVVLPEATMCAFGSPDYPLAPDAEALDGPFVAALEGAAQRYDVTVVAGMFEPAGGQRVHNTIVAVAPSGLMGSYRKLHLYDALGWRESDRIAPGDPRAEELLVFGLGDLTFGVMNCYDLRFPELARLLVDRGADVLLEPANWIAGPGKVDAWRTLLRARAIESTAYVVAAAKPAPECAGHSIVVDPSGTVLDELGEADEGLVTATLDTARVVEVRRQLPVLRNRRFTVVPR